MYESNLGGATFNENIDELMKMPARKHHDAYNIGITMHSSEGLPMRTTVTLDPDVKHLLTEAAYRQSKSFKATLNDAIRAGLAAKTTAVPKRAPPDIQVYAMGKPLVDLTKANALADELDDQDFKAKFGSQARSEHGSERGSRT